MILSVPLRRREDKIRLTVPLKPASLNRSYLFNHEWTRINTNENGQCFQARAIRVRTSHRLKTGLGLKRAQLNQMVRIYSCPLVVSQLYRYGLSVEHI